MSTTGATTDESIDNATGEERARIKAFFIALQLGAHLAVHGSALGANAYRHLHDTGATAQQAAQPATFRPEFP